MEFWTITVLDFSLLGGKYLYLSKMVPDKYTSFSKILLMKID